MEPSQGTDEAAFPSQCLFVPTGARHPGGAQDLRRTDSTLLNEVGFNRDWIEKALAHEDGCSSRAVYNKAEYAEQRRHMLQEWANMIGASSV